jgi:hypothetical protein
MEHYEKTLAKGRMVLKTLDDWMRYPDRVQSEYIGTVKGERSEKKIQKKKTTSGRPVHCRLKAKWQRRVCRPRAYPVGYIKKNNKNKKTVRAAVHDLRDVGCARTHIRPSKCVFYVQSFFFRPVLFFPPTNLEHTHARAVAYEPVAIFRVPLYEYARARYSIVDVCTLLHCTRAT